MTASSIAFAHAPNVTDINAARHGAAAGFVAWSRARGVRLPDDIIADAEPHTAGEAAYICVANGFNLGLARQGAQRPILWQPDGPAATLEQRACLRDLCSRFGLDRVPDGAESAEPEPVSAAEPIDILREVGAPPYSVNDVPPVIAAYAAAYSAATGFDVSGCLVAAVITAASAANDGIRLAVAKESHWYESARLWGVLIGKPSAGKSPVLKSAFGPLRTLHHDLVEAWGREHGSKEDKDRPARPAVFTSNATLEAIGELLLGNWRGLTFYTEEFGSWIGGIDAYRDAGGSGNRGEWLQLYDGGSHPIDRIRRGSALVKNWSCSVLAAGTPDDLRKRIKQLPDDGLIHRFIPCLMRRQRDGTAADCREAVHGWQRAVRDLWGFATEPSFAYTLAADARVAFEQERRDIRSLLYAVEDGFPPLASHLGKHPGMLARLTLVFHLLQDRTNGQVPKATVQMAARFLRTVRRHAYALFSGILQQAPTFELAQGIARAIVAEKAETVSRNYFVQNCRAYRNAVPGDQRDAIRFLEDAGWILPALDSRLYDGFPTQWDVPPAVHRLYGHHGEAHAERRRKVREAILGQ